MTLKFWDLSDGKTECSSIIEMQKAIDKGGVSVGLYGLVFAFLRHIDLRTPF